MSDHEHDRFLYEKDRCLHFGCINPFCGHGNPALPNHYRVPLDSKDVTMRLISHNARKLTLEIQPKEPGWKSATVTCADDLESCKKTFEELKFDPTPEAVAKFTKRQ